MEPKWTIHACAANVEFRILKSGQGATAYERDWKAACVGFSSKSIKHVMTVEYNYGKRIDILLADEMSRFQVQEDVGRVTITADKRRSTFCIKGVGKVQALKIKSFLTKVQAETKLCSPVKKEGDKECLQTSFHLTPLKNLQVSQPNARLSKSDTKRTSNETTVKNGKRQRASLSPSQLRRKSEECDRNTALNANTKLRKFQDFRKAQAEVRRAILTSDSDKEDFKENTSPTFSERLKGVSKRSFYGSNDDSSFVSDMKRYNILQSSPSPVKGSTPTKLPTLTDSRYHGTGSVVRALLCDEKRPEEKEDLGFQNLGNTCYMNSTLQSLFGLVPFQKDLVTLGDKLSGYIPPDSVLMTLVCLIRYKSSSSLQKSLMLRAVKLAISSNAKRFDGFSQQDAHEFLRLCLDSIQEEVREANSKLDTSVESDVDDAEHEKYICPVSTNFSFTVKNEIVCSNCNSVTSKEDEHYDLPVELHQKENWQDTVCLQSLVDHSFATEQVEHECERCSHKKATVNKILTKLPRIMMIYVKRYSYNSRFDQSEKIRQFVSIPRYITFYKHCDTDVEFHSSEKLEFLNEHNFVLHGSVISDAELKQYFENMDDFDEINTQEASTPLASHKLSDNNNNSELPNTTKDQTSRNSSGDSLLVHSASPRRLIEEISNCDHEISQKSAVRLPDIDKLQSMSEEDQIYLAMQLSMQEGSRRFSGDSSLTINCEGLSDKENKQSPSSACSKRPSNDSPVSDGSCIEGRFLPPSLYPTRETSDARSLHDGGCSSLVLGSSGLDLFRSIEALQNVDQCGTNPSSSERKIAVDDDEDEESNVIFKNQSTGSLPHSYHIVSIVSHKGGSSKFGHYVSDVLTNYKTNEWQCFDDEHVEEVREEHVLLGRQSTCYLLFYVHA